MHEQNPKLHDYPEVITVVIGLVVEDPDAVEAAGADHIVEIIGSKVWSVVKEPEMLSRVSWFGIALQILVLLLEGFSRLWVHVGLGGRSKGCGGHEGQADKV
jgi:hypothetical protein